MFCFAPSIKLSRVVPLAWNKRGTGSRLVTRPASLRSQSRNDSYTVSVLVSLMHLLQVRYRFFIHGALVAHITGHSRPPGEVGLTPRQYTVWNVEGRARSTGGLSLSRGCCLQCTVLPALGGVLPILELSHKEPKQQTDPRSCAWVVYIADDTLRHQPMGAGHMTVLQFRGPMTFCVLQWRHPMLARTERRTSCSARMITLYGARKRIQARADRNVSFLWCR